MLLSTRYILVFFFFKQKTAYEMRISDWSSDVCSSDLAVRVSTPIALYIFNRKREVLIDIEARYGLSVSIEGDDSFVAPDHRIDRVRAKTEIGRASCRERVCQYV